MKFPNAVDCSAENLDQRICLYADGRVRIHSTLAARRQDPWSSSPVSPIAMLCGALFGSLICLQVALLERFVIPAEM